MTDLLVGRQPVFNRHKDVIGYELLYRAHQTDKTARITDGDFATTQVLLNTFSEIGLDNIVGQGFAFINFTRNFLVGKYPVSLPPQRVVLEVLEDVALDKPLIESLQKFKEAGFQIAFDDVISANRVLPLQHLGLGSVAKIDLMAVNRVLLPDIVNTLKQTGILLLAEKVETLVDYDLCYRLGFDFFQGYYLCKPNVVVGKKMESSRLIVMRLLAQVTDSKADFREIEMLISQDVGLSYKLLKLVNSGYYSLSTTVNSIRQAISLIGLSQLRGWMMLILMSNVDDKPHELTAIALQRAKMCEMLGKAFGDPQAESYFLAGLFSVLDAIMDIPMSQVVASIPLTPEVISALINHEGKIGLALMTVRALEQGDWENADKTGLSPERLQSIYFESIKWATILTHEVYEKPS
ncbi:MAG: HDOD domain-containing protein [Leptolinea sp.]|nr:HDOD domain-containing protein [Leptolinea sp.]